MGDMGKKHLSGAVKCKRGSRSQRRDQRSGMSEGGRCKPLLLQGSAEKQQRLREDGSETTGGGARVRNSSSRQLGELVGRAWVGAQAPEGRAGMSRCPPQVGLSCRELRRLCLSPTAVMDCGFLATEPFGLEM